MKGLITRIKRRLQSGGPLGRIRYKQLQRKRVLRENAAALESLGVPSRVARRLAERVAKGEYTLDEAVAAYRKARAKRVRRLARSLERPSQSSLFNWARRVEAAFRNVPGPAELLWGGRRERRRKGRHPY